jgi:hypothetical protein
MRTIVKKGLPPAIIAAVGVWLLAGCVFIPTFNKRIHGREVTRDVGKENSKKPLRLGRATRDDVLRLLGDPPYWSPDGRRVAYTWTVLNGIWVWPLCFDSFNQEEARTLILTFDADDTLVSYRMTRNGQNWWTAGGGGARPILPQDMRMPLMRPTTNRVMTRPPGAAQK